MEKLGDILDELKRDGTLVDFTAAGVTPEMVRAYDAEATAAQAKHWESLARTYIGERQMALSAAGIGRTFFTYEIRPSWFPQTAQNFITRLVSRWRERHDEGRASKTLFPNIVCTGAKWTGKSSFAVYACSKVYEHCYLERNSELVPITIQWITCGSLTDLMRRGREDLSRYRRAELLVVDDVKHVSPDWVRREFENLLLHRYYQGQSTILISRLDLMARGEDGEPSLNESMPDSLENLLDLRRGMGSAQFVNDLEERAQTPESEQEGEWWND